MRWTTERRTWLGTGLEKRGRWHGVPFVIRGYSRKGLSAGGWLVLAAAAVLTIAIILVQELVI